MTGGRRLELAWSDQEGNVSLRVRGWTGTELSELGRLAAGDLSRRLAVLPSEFVVAGASLGSIQPIAGRFEVASDSISFIPRFPFLDGMDYSLLIDSAPVEPDGGPEVWDIQRPAPAGPPTTEIVSIYPSAGQLPVNQLKFYIHFSSPMSEGCAARAVQVRRADNDEPLKGVFLAMDPELWDPERRRLTLLLDPGRIKRGLVTNLEAGYPLIEGVPVILALDTQFRDAAGRPLRNGAERCYNIEPPLRVRVDPADWRCQAPVAGSKAPLVLEFDRPLDHALLEHSLRVTDPADLTLAGQAAVGPGERSWRFEPQSPWQEGRHQVMIDPRLEDLAGNSLIRVFDRDLTQAEDAPLYDGCPAVEFQCSKPASEMGKVI